VEKHFSQISALRIYLRRGDVKKSQRWWQRLVETPLSTYLVQAAMKTGVAHAAVNLSQIGYTRDASRVSYDNGETPVNTLPVCVELLAPKRMLEQFIREQARHLKNTTLVLVDGVHIADLFLQEIEETIDQHQHSVEYIRGADGKAELEVELVDASEDEEASDEEATEETPVYAELEVPEESSNALA
jgi:PII-like signaling protein